MAPRIGLLWGDFPWEQTTRKVAKLLSMGSVGRTVTRALQATGEVIPWTGPAPGQATERALDSYLSRIDLLWADVYAASEPALRRRAALGLPCPVVLFAGGAVPKALDAMLFPWQDLLRPGDGIWFTCEADRTIWHRLVKHSRLHEWVVPLGVDDSLFHPRSQSERRAARKRHSLPLEAPLLLSVGRLNVQKNLHTLLKLLASVRRHVPNAHLCFAGEEDDIGLHEFGALNTGYVAWLRQEASRRGLSDAITFTGPVFGESLAQLYAAADVAVSASIYHRENGGLAQVEAQVCGTPVVCTAWGGFKDVVLHGETGFFMDAILTKHGIQVDWATGAAHVIQLLQDTTLRTSIARRAATWAQEHFGMPALTHNLHGIVSDALHPPHSPGTSDSDPTTLAYQPSAFAVAYEAHKRACGWYPSSPDHAPRRRSTWPRWHPPMFWGRDYRLYERMMAPYATRLASGLTPDHIDSNWIPYFPAETHLDPTRHLIETHDPIWPHRRYCHPLDWTILSHIDGHTPISAITATIQAAMPSTTSESIVSSLHRFHLDGWLLFHKAE